MATKTKTEWEDVGAFSNLISFEEVGQSTEGKFIRSFDYTSKKGYDLKVHEIINPAGEKEQIIGSGNLNYSMSDIKEGDYIRIEFLGIQEGVETDHGKKDLRKFKVQRKV